MEEFEIEACRRLVEQLGTDWQRWPNDHQSSNCLVYAGLAEYLGEQMVGEISIPIVWSGPVLCKRTPRGIKDQAVSILQQRGFLPRGVTGLCAQVPEFIRLTPAGIRFKTQPNQELEGALQKRAPLTLSVVAKSTLGRLRCVPQSTGKVLSTEQEKSAVREANAKNKNMKVDDANEVLLALLKTDPARYAEMNQRDLAKQVGCSRGTLAKTDAYQNIEAVREELRMR